MIEEQLADEVGSAVTPEEFAATQTPVESSERLLRPCGTNLRQRLVEGHHADLPTIVFTNKKR